MSILKNKFFIIIVIAILAGGVLGLYISGNNKADIPDNYTTSGSGVDAEKIGEVIQKLNNLTGE
ncbi:MAG: hypothetical protein PHQ95_04680 [Candidatus Gracilibacteria bacterium]|nr:hypothetical protein [Candidatus Gracilibacteria bacterium]